MKCCARGRAYTYTDCLRSSCCLVLRKRELIIASTYKGSDLMRPIFKYLGYSGLKYSVHCTYLFHMPIIHSWSSSWPWDSRDGYSIFHCSLNWLCVFCNPAIRSDGLLDLPISGRVTLSRGDRGVEAYGSRRLKVNRADNATSVSQTECYSRFESTAERPNQATRGSFAKSLYVHKQAGNWID